MHSVKIRFVTGPSNTLFDGVYVCTFQPRNLTCWGSEGVNFATLLKVVKGAVLVSFRAQDQCG